MVARLQFYDSTDTTPQSATIAAGDVDGGTTYTLPLLHLWDDIGGLFGDTTTAEDIIIYAAVTLASGEFLSGAAAGQSIPILDQRWIGAQVTGQDKTGDSTMEDQATSVVYIGTGSVLVLKDIPKNCARFIQFTVRVPSGVSNQPYDVTLYAAPASSSQVLASLLGIVSGGGVIPDWMDASALRLTRGGSVTASGADAVVVANRSWVAAGLPLTRAKESITLNQTAADGALASGQKYVARLSQPATSSAITVTKSNKGATPAKPAVPVGEINLGCVNIAFQSGSSVINTADLDLTDVLYGQYLVTDGGGLNAKVGAGVAIASTDAGPSLASSILVPLTDSATNTVWLKPDGNCSANTTGLPPVFGSQKLAIVVTSSGAITSITDARTFVGHAIDDYVMTLAKIGTFNATAADIAWATAPFDAVIVKVCLEVGKPGTAASGSFIANLTTRPPGTGLGTAGTTIYTSSGSDDYRATIAYNASVLRAESVGHEVVTITKDSRIAAGIAAVPGTITVDPSDFIVMVYLRRLQ